MHCYLGGKKEKMNVERIEFQGVIYKAKHDLGEMLIEANDVLQKLSGLVTKSFAAFNKAVQETTPNDAKRPNHEAEESPPAKKSAYQGHNGMPVNQGPFHPSFNAPPSNHIGGGRGDVAVMLSNGSAGTAAAAAGTAFAAGAGDAASITAATKLVGVSVTPEPKKKVNPYQPAAKKAAVQPVCLHPEGW